MTLIQICHNAASKIMDPVLNDPETASPHAVPVGIHASAVLPGSYLGASPLPDHV